MNAPRLARFQDHWRRTYTRQYRTRYQRLDFESLRCFQDGSVQFGSGLSVILGANGVGKSTLAAALAEMVAKPDGVREGEHAPRLAGSILRATLVEEGAEKHAEVRQDGAARIIEGTDLDAEYAWFEPAALAMRTRFAAVRDQNFREVLDGAAARIWTADELHMAQYVVGKSYDQIEVLEVSDYNDMERFPYVRVTCQGAEYGSEAMGLGELCLLLTLWKLTDLRSHCVLILEEPENHVSPKSQEALMNALARACDEQGLWIVAVTHSPAIANKVPLEHVRLVSETANGSRIIVAPTRTQVAAILGGGVAYRTFALVEDDVAKEVAISLMFELDSDLAGQVEVAAAAGEAAITSALRALPRSTQNWISFVGIYDGDLRISPHPPGLRWPRIFLPGTNAPEIELRAAAAAPRAATVLADRIGRAEQSVELALHAAQGLNAHDWLPAVAGTLGISRSDAVRALVSLWLASSDDARKSAEEFVRDLRNSMG